MYAIGATITQVDSGSRQSDVLAARETGPTSPDLPHEVSYFERELAAALKQILSEESAQTKAAKSSDSGSDQASRKRSLEETDDVLAGSLAHGPTARGKIAGEGEVGDRKSFALSALRERGFVSPGRPGTGSEAGSDAGTAVKVAAAGADGGSIEGGSARAGLTGVSAESDSERSRTPGKPSPKLTDRELKLGPTKERGKRSGGGSVEAAGAEGASRAAGAAGADGATGAEASASKGAGKAGGGWDGSELSELPLAEGPESEAASIAGHGASAAAAETESSGRPAVEEVDRARSTDRSRSHRMKETGKSSEVGRDEREDVPRSPKTKRSEVTERLTPSRRDKPAGPREAITRSSNADPGNSDRSNVIELEVRDLRSQPEQDGGTPTNRTGWSDGVGDLGADQRTSGGNGAQRGAGNRGVLANLSREIRENLSSDIVRSAKIVLRNSPGGQVRGEVRLSLHPEELGRVRVQLHMQENVLMGKIVVDNSAVRDVFEQNLPQLIRSFEEAGWETGSLDVSVSDGETDGRREQDGSGSMRGRTAVKEDLSEHRYTVEDRGLVDLMA